MNLMHGKYGDRLNSFCASVQNATHCGVDGSVGRCKHGTEYCRFCSVLRKIKRLTFGKRCPKVFMRKGALRYPLGTLG